MHAWAGIRAAGRPRPRPGFRPCRPLAGATRRGLAALALGAAAIAAIPADPARAEVYEVGANGTFFARHGSEPVRDDAAARPGGGVEDGIASVEAAPDVPSPALTLVGAPRSPELFQLPLMTAARRYDVSPELLAALVWQESRWQPAALSPKGAMGLAQLMPATARALAVDPRDARDNLAGAAHYLRQLLDLFDGDVERALAAYNAGPARVLKAGGVPAIAETRTYVSAIMDRLAAVRGAPTTGGTEP